MMVDYDSKMKVTGRPGYSYQPLGELFEAGNRTLIADGSREAMYEEITGNASLKIEDPERISPTKVTMTECYRGRINDCRTHNLDPNKLSWELIGWDSTSILYPDTKNMLCVDTGQSVAEKRGIIDCGARGAGIIILSDRDQSLFAPQLNIPTRGTLLSYNSRGVASGKFIIRASITKDTPGFEQFAGSHADYSVEIKNRLDLHLSTNVSNVFEGYGVPLVSVETISEAGFSDNVTYKSVSCSGTLSNGQSVGMTKRPYENRFSFNSRLDQLPKGTSISINCSASTYDGQSASVRMVQIKL
jgi:hypothetical protein